MMLYPPRIPITVDIQEMTTMLTTVVQVSLHSDKMPLKQVLKKAMDIAEILQEQKTGHRALACNPRYMVPRDNMGRELSTDGYKLTSKRYGLVFERI